MCCPCLGPSLGSRRASFEHKLDTAVQASTLEPCTNMVARDETMNRFCINIIRRSNMLRHLLCVLPLFQQSNVQTSSLSDKTQTVMDTEEYRRQQRYQRNVVVLLFSRSTASEYSQRWSFTAPTLDLRYTYVAYAVYHANLHSASCQNKKPSCRIA